MAANVLLHFGFAYQQEKKPLQRKS